MSFDLEKARATYSAGCAEDAANLVPDLIAEIERLRTENRELLHEIKDLSRIIDTGYKQLVCDRTGLNERQDLPEGIRRMAARIHELEDALAEYRKPVEQMDTMRLAEWNEKLTELLSAPESERGYFPWQIAVGYHLERFAKSWHSARIAELEAKAAALQKIVVSDRVRLIARCVHDCPEGGCLVDEERISETVKALESDLQKVARDQLAKEHSKALAAFLWIPTENEERQNINW